MLLEYLLLQKIDLTLIKQVYIINEIQPEFC
jgi:hypothetical protein